MFFFDKTPPKVGQFFKLERPEKFEKSHILRHLVERNHPRAGLKFFKKCGFFAIFGKQIPRCARPSLWRRSPTGELPSNPAPKATFLEKNRTSVDDCAPRNAPKIGFFERFQGLSDLKNWPTLGVFLSKKNTPDPGEKPSSSE